MADNLFKDHSIAAIEACISKALTALVGRETTVAISSLETGQMLPSYTATFDVVAKHDVDWGADPFTT